VKFLPENSLVDVTSYKSVPPAEMIADHQNREGTILDMTIDPYFPEVPPDHPPGIKIEKLYIQSLVPCLYHGLADFAL
jgi:hypothetical protein